MASSAAMTRYRDETVSAFEARVALLRATVTTEHMLNGNVATFLVAGSGGATPVTRGLDGRIPGRNNSLTQNACTLVEWHDKPTYTGFNAFESQGDARRISQDGCVAVMNRKIDDDILGSAGFGAATLGDSSASTADLNWILGHQAELGENDVDIGEMDKVFCALTPKAFAYLMQVKEFASGEYVEIKPFAGPARKFYNWAGINFIRSTRLSGMGTSSATCFMWHRDAIGHAIANGHPEVVPGYNAEDDYEFVRCTGFFGTKLLQNTGVRKMLHNDT
jgi:hypothetical protein